ncbi:DUF4124 domain-containing protein [Azonexus sp.]|uniref:DUF4124 domain-containing protein n=1 Tax=Azonexus sp. TaxID=1872668 RepID=UPI0035B40326
MKFRLLLLAAVAALWHGAAAADVYKCRSADGRIEISNSPCAGGSRTLTARPEERVSEEERQRAEQDVERMRDYVRQREASQRAETAAELERERLAAQQRAAAARSQPRVYGSPEECRQDIGQMALEAEDRQRLESECGRIARPQTIYVPVGVARPRPGHFHAHPKPETRRGEAPPPPAPPLAAPPPPAPPAGRPQGGDRKRDPR